MHVTRTGGLWVRGCETHHRSDVTDCVRVTTACKRLMDLPGVTVSDVDSHPARPVVTVGPPSGRLGCPGCVYNTRFRYDARPLVPGPAATCPAVATPLQRSISSARSRWPMGAELS